LKAEYDWEDKTKRTIKERLGVVEEETDDDDVSEIEGEKNDNDEDDGEKIGDDVKKIGAKVVGLIINESKEDDDDDDDDEGHQQCHSNREKSRR